MSTEERARDAGARWLARMRWGAVGIQAASILIASEALGGALPLARMWSLVGLGALSNGWLTLRGDRAVRSYRASPSKSTKRVGLMASILQISRWRTPPQRSSG